MIKKHSTLTVIFAVLFVILLAAAIILWPTIFGGDGDNTITINAVEGEHILIGSADIAVRDILSGNVSDEIKSLVSLKDDGTLSAPRYTRQLIFEKVDRENIQALEVSNEHGSYKIFRNAADNFELEGFPGLIFDDMVFSYLVVAAGHTEVQLKMTDDATEADYAEYGLDKPIAHWTITTISGDRHTVYIGSNLLTDGGYYVQYEGRDSIYILNNTMQYALLQPAETLITPLLTAGMTQNDYFYATNFTIWKNEELFLRIANVPTEEMSDPNAIVETEMVYPKGYKPHDNNYFEMLYGMIALQGTQTVKVGADDATLDEYGLLHPTYSVYYQFGNMEFYLRFSEKQADGTYYAASNLSDFKIIVKIDASSVSWLENPLFFWVAEYPFNVAITKIASMDVKAEGLDISFALHHGKDAEGNNSLAVTADVKAAKETAPSVIEIGEEDSYTFRQFYRTLLSIALQEYTPLSDEEKSALTADEDKLLLSFSYTTVDGDTVEYKFYQYTTRHAFVTVNGHGEFYTFVDLLTKTASDAEKLLKGIDIDSYAKN